MSAFNILFRSEPGTLEAGCGEAVILSFCFNLVSKQCGNFLVLDYIFKVGNITITILQPPEILLLQSVACDEKLHVYV